MRAVSKNCHSGSSAALLVEDLLGVVAVAGDGDLVAESSDDDCALAGDACDKLLTLDDGRQ